MSRPRKYRRVEYVPDITYFKPAGAPLRDVDEVRLSVEEAEAIRLKDLEGLEQEEGAEKMNVSRPTFQRVLASARRKIADVLLNGKAIRIEGGNFEMTWRRFRCHRGHEWELDKPVGVPPELCPVCRQPDVQPVPSPVNSQSIRGRGRGRGRHLKDLPQ
ncbi:MAG: DUF134 domain-containing protein [Dehalococcoidales bacterium]|nr:DUF134 domain-containing protein [Dehalococcoidales bacterium]